VPLRALRSPNREISDMGSSKRQDLGGDIFKHGVIIRSMDPSWLFGSCCLIGVGFTITLSLKVVVDDVVGGGKCGLGWWCLDDNGRGVSMNICLPLSTVQLARHDTRGEGDTKFKVVSSGLSHSMVSSSETVF